MPRCEILRSTPTFSLRSSTASAAYPGEWAWPIDPQALAGLYFYHSDHARACQIKAEGIAGGGWQAAPPALATLLPVSVLTRLALDLEVYANAFIELQRTRGGQIIGLNILPAPTITLRQAGGLRQRVIDQSRWVTIDLVPEDTLHLRALCPLGYHYSVPVWTGARAMMDLIYAATRYNARFFESGAIPEHAVIHKGGPELSATQKDTIKTFFKDEFQGVERSRRTLLLSGLQDTETIEFRNVSQHQEGEFLKLIEAARVQLPSAHGVPPRLLGIMSAGQLGGVSEVAQQMLMFQEFTVKPRQRQLIDQLRPLLDQVGVNANDLALQLPDLTPAGDDAKDLPGLVQSGIVTAEEAREILNLNKSTDNTAALMAALLAKL